MCVWKDRHPSESRQAPVRISSRGIAKYRQIMEPAGAEPQSPRRCKVGEDVGRICSLSRFTLMNRTHSIGQASATDLNAANGVGIPLVASSATTRYLRVLLAAVEIGRASCRERVE